MRENNPRSINHYEWEHENKDPITQISLRSKNRAENPSPKSYKNQHFEGKKRGRRQYCHEKTSKRSLSSQKGLHHHHLHNRAHQHIRAESTHFHCTIVCPKGLKECRCRLQKERVRTEMN